MSSTPRIQLIAPRFQWRLVVEFVLLQAALTALFAFGLYLFMNSEIQANLASAHARYRSFSEMMLPVVLAVAAFNILLATGIVTVYVLRLTHRIARPLLRVRAALEELQKRRILVHTGIGEGDELFELSSDLRGALGTVRQDLLRLQEIRAALQAAQLRGDPTAVAKETAALEDLLAQWREAAPEASGDAAPLG